MERLMLIPFILSAAIPLSHWRLIVEDFSFEIPQAEVQVGASFWLQGLGEHDVTVIASLRLPLDWVLDGLRGEVVNNRIKAAVGHSNAEGYWEDGSDHRLHKAAFQGVGADKSIENQVYIVRDEAKTKNKKVYNYHLQDLFFVQFPPTADGLGATQGLQHHDRATYVEQ